jgi:hypothetical protein
MDDSQRMAEIYRDARLLAIAAIREAALEFDDTEGHTRQIYERAAPYVEKWSSTEDDSSAALLALIVAMARLAFVHWRSTLELRLGHVPSQEETLADLDRWEMGDLESWEREQD